MWDLGGRESIQPDCSNGKRKTFTTSLKAEGDEPPFKNRKTSRWLKENLTTRLRLSVINPFENHKTKALP